MDEESHSKDATSVQVASSDTSNVEFWDSDDPILRTDNSVSVFSRTIGKKRKYSPSATKGMVKRRGR